MTTAPSEVFRAAMAAMASGDEEAIAAFYSEKTRYWDPLAGPITGLDVVPYLARIGQQLTGLTVSFEHVTEDESTACIEWTQRSESERGAHTLHGSTFATVRDGILVEQRDYFDYRSSLGG